MNASDERVAKTPEELKRALIGLSDLQLQCLMHKAMGEPTADQRLKLVEICMTVIHWSMGTRPGHFAAGVDQACGVLIPAQMREAYEQIAAEHVGNFTSICEMLDKAAGDV